MRIRPTLLRLAAATLLTTGLAATAAPAAVAQDIHTVNVELILDSSGSMAERIGTQSRMQIARQVMRRVVAAIPEREGINVGFRIYGHLGDNTTAGRPVSCRSSELVVPIDGVDKEAIIAEVDAARPTGWTPLAYSLGQAGRDFPIADPGILNAVVLVTDGLETCGGDPCAVAGALNASEIALVTHVVGFALGEDEQGTLQCIADEGGGLLLGAQNADQLAGALFTILEDLEVISLTGFLEIESVESVWPDATAVCEGPVTDSNPEGDPVTVRFDRTNLHEVPIGFCDVTWIEPSGEESGVEVVIEADRLTRIRGSLIAFPQGAGERYVLTDLAGSVRIWEAPIESGDRVWVRPGQYHLELLDRTGNPILIWSDLNTRASTILRLLAGTEP